MHLKNRSASLFILVLLSALSACASAPDPAPIAPLAGPLPELKEAPLPPLLDGLLATAVEGAPELPNARRQSIDEVFQDHHDVVGAPEAFKLQPEEVVVIAVPEDLGMAEGDVRRTRVQLATAFLNKGHLAKDAGRYSETTFRTNSWPDGDDRKQVSETVRTDETGASEVVSTTTSTNKPWYWDSWLAWQSERGLRLDLSDPTSLWVSQLGKYDAIKSRYFLRVFDLAFEAAVEEVTLNNDVSEENVEAYRESLAKRNQRVDLFNQQRRMFAQRRQQYDADYVIRTRANEQLLDAYLKDFDVRWAAYEQQFREWKVRNPESPKVADVQQAPQVPTPLPPKVKIEVPEARNKISDADLASLLQDEKVEEVAVTTIRILAEVVDSETGEVKWAGEFTGKTRAGVGDRVRLLEVFIEKALH